MSTKTLVMVVALAATMPAQRGKGSPQLTEIGTKAHKIVDAHVAGVVTVNVVIKIEFRGQSQERRLQSRGMLVSDTGLIMTHDGVVEPNVNVQARGRRIQDVKTAVEDIKVVFGNEEEEQESFLVGKDSKLGFAFLQVRGFDAKKRSIPVPDYSKAQKPQVGKIVVTPNRLEKGFDYAPYFAFGWIVGEIKKPQKALLLSSGTHVGLPAYDLSGNLVGAHARLKPSVGRSNPRTVLLKGGVVNGAIQQAQKRAQKMLAEQKSDGDDQ
ncbi:MAG: hypothetical protein ACYST0_08860 [Planctomycetota bacterium]